MPSQLQAVTFDAQEPGGVAAFWGAILGRELVTESGGVLLPGDETQVGLRFVAAATEPSGRDLHLHLTSAAIGDQQRTVDRAIELGGGHLDVGQLPEEGHIVLADTGGNAFCVIEADNGFLAGTGFLGEVACDGTREVGLFWRDVLGWTLTWDQDTETSIQSPLGGTRISWGGLPVAAKDGRNQQRFDLTTDDVAAEVERLVGLGATRLEDRDGVVELADPDGNEFSLSAG
jgi:predicted enzyme related to lactoylglutathione lyase